MGRDKEGNPAKMRVCATIERRQKASTPRKK